MKINMESIKINWMELPIPERGCFDQALSYSLQKIKSNLSEFTDMFPSPVGSENRFLQTENQDWTEGFWTGMIWTAYALTKDEEFLRVGRIHSKSFKERLEQDIVMQHHDIGFLFSPTCVADYKLTGDMEARDIAIRAAKRLSQLYRPYPGIVQRGGDMGNLSDPHTGKFIVDCLMNIPLWFWTAEETGDQSYKEMAYQHALNNIYSLVQESGAVIQQGIANLQTGEITADSNLSQGKGGVDACWSRGQAWAIYGFAIAYDYTRDERFLEASKCLTSYFLNRLPDDYVANWDLYYLDNNDQRDSSASAIAVCGMLELATHLPIYDKYRKMIESAATKILESLTKYYLTTTSDNSNALLKSGVYAYRREHHRNEPCIWGDYYYVEALWRVLKPYKRFW